MNWTEELNYQQNKFEEFENKLDIACSDPENYDESDIRHYHNKMYYHKGKRDMLIAVLESMGLNPYEKVTFTGSSVWVVLG